MKKMEKSESMAKELQYQHKKDMDDANERLQDNGTRYEKQIRELRSQMSMKGKDIQNQREEISDLEARLTQKQNELKTVRSQLQVLQQRYDEAMSNADENQAGYLRQVQNQNNKFIDELHKQMDDLRNENLDLKDVIRNIKKEKIMIQTNAQNNLI